MRPAAAEAIGVYFLVLAGTGAIVVNQVSGGVIGHAGIALTFGLAVLVLVYVLGEISGAHLNPAVTVALAAGGGFGWRRVPGYVAAQCLGAVAASGTLRVLFPEATTLGQTLPAGPAWRAVVIEGLLTFLLMLVVLSVSSGRRERGPTAGVAAGCVVGCVVGLGAMFAGPITGASMNPARTLGPALVSGETGWLWIYLAGPLVGALGAVAVWRKGRGGPRR